MHPMKLCFDVQYRSANTDFQSFSEPKLQKLFEEKINTGQVNFIAEKTVISYTVFLEIPRNNLAPQKPF